MKKHRVKKYRNGSWLCAVFFMTAVMSLFGTACKKNSSPKDGDYFIRRITETGMVLASAEAKNSAAEFEAPLGPDVMFSVTGIEPCCEMQVACDFKEFLEYWDSQTEYYVHFYAPESGEASVVQIREKIKESFRYYDRLEEGILGQLFYYVDCSEKEASEGEKLNIWPVECVMAEDSERLEELTADGLLEQGAASPENGLYVIEYPEEQRTVGLQESTRFYVMEADGARRVSAAEMKSLFDVDDRIVFRIFLEDDKALCIIADCMI